MKLVIVGGVAGGASAAARARRLSEDAEIIMFERGEAPSFANCGLPYYLGGVIEKRRRLLVARRENLEGWYRLDIRTRQEVTAIDRQAKKVRVRNLESGEEYEETYDKLILAPGAKPFRPPIPGIDLPGVYSLRNLEDVDRLHEVVTGGARKAVVVGAGFIGLEVAENLVHRKIETHVVELQPQVLPPWDREMTLPIAQALEENGVRLWLGDSVVSIQRKPYGNQLEVELKSGERLTADFVVMAVGVRPESELAKEAGLELGINGTIRVDVHMRTSDPDIYAVGDVVEVVHVVSGKPIHLPLAGPANRQGRIAADHIFGRDSQFRGVQGTAIVGVFGKQIAATGLSEKLLRQLEMTYEKVYVHPYSHSTYYPGAQQMSLKLLFDPQDGRILGAQAVGGEGVDKRIDVLAMAIQAGMTVFDLEESELAYAPPFGSAKDPVNMAGFVAANVIRGDQPVFHVEQLTDPLPSDLFILDVRTEREFATGSVPGAVHIPLHELRQRLSELPRDKRIVVVCNVGFRAYLATRILLQNGFDAANLSGGYTSYVQMRGPYPGLEEMRSVQSWHS